MMVAKALSLITQCLTGNSFSLYDQKQECMTHSCSGTSNLSSSHFRQGRESI
jgi:hypothetical protein